jgi:hypothetical protein
MSGPVSANEKFLRRPLVQAAYHNRSHLCGHYTEKPRMRKHHREDADGNLGVGEILIKFVMTGERTEGLKTYSSAYFSVGRSSAANDKRLFAGVEGLRLSRHEVHLAVEFAAGR